MWIFKSYEAASGKNDVQERYDRATDGVRAEFEVALEFLEGTPRKDWDRPKAARLHRQKYPDYYEIRFFADKLQHRPIGYFGPAEDDFTVLLWATEKGNQLQPKSWFKTAEYRRQLLEEGTANATPLVLDED
jgi:hypothetical protein